MPSAYNLHPESRYSSPSPKLHHKVGLALAFIAFGSIAGASGVVLQMAGHEPDSNGSSVIAAAPRNPSATHSAGIALPASPAVSAVEASSSNPAQAAPVDAMTAAAPEPPTSAAAPEPITSAAAEPAAVAVTESPSPPAAAAKKPNKRAARSQSRRDRGWYDAYAWSPRADYGRGRGYGRDFARPAW
jgi:hypothetical protein